MPTPDSSPRIRWKTAAPALFGAAAILALGLVLAGALQYPLISPIKDFPGLMTGRYFDVQGLTMTVGRLDVPCDSLQWEAITIGDRCYGYFGLTPSLFRIMLNGLCLSCFGQWSRLMMVTGGLVYFAACLLLARRALGDFDLKRDGIWATGFALAMSLGSSLPFILSDPYGYHEAILWANGLALLSIWALGSYVDGGQRRMLRLALVLIFLTLHTRFTVGVGVAAGGVLWLILPALPARDRFRALRSALTPVLFIAVLTMTPVAVNFLKFGAAVPPAQSQKFYENFPERLEKVKNGIFQTSNFVCNAALYLSPGMIEITDAFPYLHPGYGDYWFAGRPLPARLTSTCGSAHIESLDPMYSLTAALPGPLLLFVAGLAVLAVRWRRLAGQWLPPLAGSALACLPLLFLSSVTYRYTLDFMPMLALGGVVAWREMTSLSRWGRGAAVLLVVALTSWGLAVNLSAGLFSGSPQPYMFQLAHDVHRILGLTR